MSLIRRWGGRVYRHFSPPAVDGWYRRIELDYPVKPQPRWGWGRPPHPHLYEIIDRGRDRYVRAIEGLYAHIDAFQAISVSAPESSPEPRWVNDWIPPLDTAALYSFVASGDPRTYIEVGSGNSTKFVRRAIEEHGLQTRIVSIDPHPRAEVDALCDEVIRSPMEEVAIETFDRLGPGDVLFVDSSHRCFPNSDVTAIFFDVLPRLQAGVLVEFHDIALPWDYPQSDADIFYTEQYLLGVALLAEGPHIETALPNAFVRRDPELAALVEPFWTKLGLGEGDRGGCSYWLQTR